MDPAITIQHVSRRFVATQALDDVSLEIGVGEIISLIGQSGCGKSTLLRIIAGLDAEHSGEVRLFGQQVSGRDRFVEPEQRNVGFMLQDYALFPHLTVRQNIGFGLRKMAAAAAQTRVCDVASRLMVDGLLDKYPHMLSGGEQQRVALARALAPSPRILLMDEPFSNLDRRLAENVRSETLGILRELGTTAVLVTHDPEEALASSDRIVLLRSGKVLQTGTPYEIYFHPNAPYSADYFCAYNKLPAVFRGGVFETAAGRFPASFEMAEGGRATVYIRPEAIGISRDGDGLKGRIISRTFMGNSERVVLQLADSRVTLTAQVPRQIPDGGAEVQVVIPSIGMLAFPE